MILTLFNGKKLPWYFILSFILLLLLLSDLFPSLSHVSCPFVWWNVIITPGCRDENFHNGEILFNRAEMLNCHLLICWNLWQGLMDGVDTLTLFFLQSYFPFLNIFLFLCEKLSKLQFLLWYLRIYKNIVIDQISNDFLWILKDVFIYWTITGIHSFHRIISSKFAINESLISTNSCLRETLNIHICIS